MSPSRAGLLGNRERPSGVRKRKGKAPAHLYQAAAGDPGSDGVEDFRLVQGRAHDNSEHKAELSPVITAQPQLLQSFHTYKRETDSMRTAAHVRRCYSEYAKSRYKMHKDICIGNDKSTCHSATATATVIIGQGMCWMIHTRFLQSRQLLKPF